MSPSDDAHDDEADEANSRLADGLRACRSIVSDYRAMIAGDQDGEQLGADGAQGQVN